nr:PREDICTED: signal peptide, CUB and EGF-like domain-containing protein 3 [Rhinolophus sinicus]
MRSSPGGISKGSCEPCPAGSFCPSLGLSYPTGSCVAGSECPLDIVASSPMALPCPQGHFCQPGAAWPAVCHRGGYQPSLGSDTCLRCPPGFHCPHPGTIVPRLCPAHTYCPAGTWSPPPCPPGTFTPQDTAGLREQGDCSVCPPGHYCRSVTAHSPLAAAIRVHSLGEEAQQLWPVLGPALWVRGRL